MTALINASTSSGVVVTSDTSGSLAIQNNGTTAMTITSGNVGIGMSPTAKLQLKQSGADDKGIYIESSANTNVMRLYHTGSAAYISSSYGSSGSYTPLIFNTSDTERMRIDSSGNLLVNTTTMPGSDAKVYVQPATGNYSFTSNSLDSGTQFHFAFRYNGSGCGGITSNNTNTAYNTFSDYRLKENIAPMTGALAKVALLKPCTYTWKLDNSNGQGFIAHELAEVVPDAVTGEKDAVDAKGEPMYQGVDTSYLVATLTAAIQELKAELDATKAEVAALKGTV